MDKINPDQKDAIALYGKEFFQNFFPTIATKRLLVAVLGELVTGKPTTIERVAAQAKVSIDEAQAFLDPVAQWDDQHRLIGWGLTRIPTQHSYEVNGHHMYVFCAGDALMFPVLTGLPAHITSTCHATGQPISVDVTPEKVMNVQPTTTVVSSLPWEAVEWKDIVQLLCNNTNFFASAEIAQGWLKKHPGSRVVSAADEFETQRRGIVELWGDMLPSINKQ